MCKSTDDASSCMPTASEERRFEAVLRRRGLDLTAQRRAVFEAIYSCPGHICADHILSIVAQRYPGTKMNKTTVYRALDLLLSLRLISEHKCGDGSAQYEPASRSPHSHLLCRGCGRLFEMDEKLSAKVRENIHTRHNFIAELDSYPILGLCVACKG